ncbi:MAG: class A beta-lactamase [Pseudomonadota bacterium]
MNALRRCAPLIAMLLIPACVSAPKALPKRPPVFIPAPKPKPLVQAPRPSPPPPALFPALRAIAASFDGRLGIAVTRIDSDWAFSSQGDGYFPQQSVSKLWVALTVFDAVDNGRLTLDQKVVITRADLTLFHQPIAQLVGAEGYETNVSELLLRAMTQSDNTANDSLLRTVGGPSAVRNMLERKGLGGIRFAGGERALQSATAGMTWQQRYSVGRTFYAERAKVPESIRREALDRYLATLPDGAQPQAIVSALAKLKRGTLLSANSTRVLLSLMNESRTGRQRLAGGVPEGWRFGHKTGTGQDLAGTSTGYNDVGIITAPDGTSYAVAVMIANTRQPVPVRQQMMQAVSGAIAGQHRK